MQLTHVHCYKNPFPTFLLPSIHCTSIFCIIDNVSCIFLGCTSIPDQRTKTVCKEAGTRKGPGYRWYSHRSLESYYSGEASTYSGPIQHVSGKRPFPETMETPEISSHTEGIKARIPRHHLFGGYYACSTQRASCMRG